MYSLVLDTVHSTITKSSLSVFQHSIDPNVILLEQVASESWNHFLPFTANEVGE